MQRILKDPLVHFLVVGAMLFAIYSLRDEADDPRQITINAEQVSQLMQAASAMRGEALSREEIEALIEPTIRDEVFYREALALGLDQNDDEVRTRLVEKVRYLTEDLADPEPGSDRALREFFESNPELFRIPETITFDQLFFSPSRRGEGIAADLAAALSALRAGAEPDAYGDSTPLRDRFENAPREQVSVLFGETITKALFTMAPGEWQGPFESDFGQHLVRLISHSDAVQPAFEDVSGTAAEVFAEYQRQQRNEAAYRDMRARYEIIIEWPDQDDAE
jgi:peptidyl-prolyl cis-trans isomerase C